ncbi:unnamed protein product [Cladocopium goreaui]|uniref:ATP-dependent DNA helicase CHR12 n=1 Tax=Cladocopium goreaui TaxID=2562237 RepID=A0A9P1D1M7_9DINO|nr:unnamed protein product [Cladocopium goreaui]
MRCDEILQWLPTFRFLVYRGNASQLAAVEKETIAETVNAGNKVSIVLTNYETMASHDAFLGNFPWCCLKLSWFGFLTRCGCKWREWIESDQF